MAVVAMGSHRPPSIPSPSSSSTAVAAVRTTMAGLHAGAVLCARATSLGHVHALRELDHYIQDGYGVRGSIAKGHYLLPQANALELASAFTLGLALYKHSGGGPTSLLSDFDYHVAVGKMHWANQFLVKWFTMNPVMVGKDGGEEKGMWLCSYIQCGRPKKRQYEFRRCSVCGVVNHISRACRALYWKIAHKALCTPMDRWLERPTVAADDNGEAVLH